LSKARGFTLIETAIAIMLLVIMMAGGMAYFFYSNDSLQTANHRRIAAEIAHSSMELIKSMNYSTLVSGSNLTNVSIGYLTGQESITIYDEINGADGAYRQATVNITWGQPNKNVPGEVVLDTYLSPQ